MSRNCFSGLSNLSPGSAAKVPSRFLHGDRLTNCHRLFPQKRRFRLFSGRGLHGKDDEDETKKCSLNSFWHFSCCVKAYLMVGWISRDGVFFRIGMTVDERGRVRLNESQTGKWEVGEVLFELLDFWRNWEWNGKLLGSWKRLVWLSLINVIIKGFSFSQIFGFSGIPNFGF